MTPRTILLRVPIWLLALCSLVGVARGATYWSLVGEGVAAYNIPGQGDSVEDYIGAADAAWTGTPTYVTSPYGKAWSLGGVRRLEVAANPRKNLTSWGVLARVRRTGSVTFGMIISNPTTPEREIRFNNNTDTLAVQFFGYASTILPSAAVLNAWEPLAAGTDGTNTFIKGPSGETSGSGNGVGVDTQNVLCIGSRGSSFLANVDIAELIILPRKPTASDYTEFAAGPEPTLTSGSLTIDSGGVTADTTSYSANGNGSLSYSYRWEHYVAGQWDDTGYSDKDVGPAEFGGVNGRNYRLIKIASNPGGTLETASNTITYTAAKKRKVHHHSVSIVVPVRIEKRILVSDFAYGIAA